MAKDPGKKSAEGGLELDRINFSNIVSDSTRKPVDSSNPSPPPEDGPRGKKKANLTLVAVLAVLALLMAFTAIFKKQEFSFTLLSDTKNEAPLKNYLRVGPVTATLANEDIVKFSIDIDCGNPELKEQLAAKDTQIRDQIVAVLTEPGTETLIAKRDYETVKAKIKERLGSLGTVPVEDIYFSELLMY